MLTGEIHYLKNTDAVMGNRASWHSGNVQDLYYGLGSVQGSNLGWDTDYHN
jgi:hypothetical protein